MESYFTPIIGSYNNSSFITKSNAIEVQGIFSMSSDYIILYNI
jgi:hypothetical protein